MSHPPENFMPDESRHAMEQLAEWLKGDRAEVEQQWQRFSGEDLPEHLWQVYHRWSRATDRLSKELAMLSDETVGEEWMEWREEL